MSEEAAKTPVTLGDVFADLWQARVFITTGVVMAAIVAGLFVFAATPYYRAQMIVSPANPMNGAEASSLLADDNLFALRYLVQRVGVANSSDFMRFENTYNGPSVSELLLKDRKIAEGLAQDTAFSFSTPEKNWSAGRLSEYIGKRVRFDPVGGGSLRRMVYRHPDREFGVYFLQNLHRLTDELIRQKIRQDALKRTRYLQEAVRETNNPEHRRALTTLLLEQERLRMLVSIETPYAAAVIEPPAASVKASWPDAALVFPVFVLAGAILGFAVYGFVMIGGEGAQSGEEKVKPQSARRWFRTDSKNENAQKRPLTKRDAA